MKRFKPLFLIIILLLGTGCTLLDRALGIDPETNNAENAQTEVTLQQVTPQPSPTPTMMPEVRLSMADIYLFSGELDKALQDYETAFNQSTQDVEKAAAKYGQGRVYMAMRNYPAAIDAFTHILGQYAQTEIVANTHFLLGQCYQEQEEYMLAANAFAQFQALRPGIIDAYVLQLQAENASQAGDYYGAIYALQQAAAAEPAPDAADINLRIGQQYQMLEDLTSAIQYYQNAYDLATTDYQKATANLLSGQAYQELGQTEQAIARWEDAVMNFPMAYDSFTSLSILVSQDYPVDEYMRGVVDYYAGSYFYAIQAFERYLAGNPQHDGSVHYFKGLSHYYSGEYLQAIQEYQTLIDEFPLNRFWDDAWEEIAFIYWNTPNDIYPDIDDYQASVATRLEFVERVPQSDYAPLFLYTAGRALEYNGDLEQAATVWSRLINEYPMYTYSYQALYLAGISLYRLEKYEEALNTFQRCLGLAATSEEKASSYLWLGKTYQMMGEEDQAREAWQLAENADPTDYYGIRAGDLLNGRETLVIEAPYELGYDLDAERPEAEAWLRTTFDLPAETNLQGLGSMSGDLRVIRGTQYWELGLYEQASREFESLRVEQAVDPLNTYLLLNHFLDLGLYKSAIQTCRNLLDLAGLDDLSSLGAPIYFTHIRFGAYFRNLTVAAANEQNIHPLLLFSLLRQESLFEPFISSSAGAQGIAQIMPATGAETADRYGYPANYETRDLLRAEVGINLGAFYLRQQIDFLNGDIYAGLAAYNGGPGNALVWRSLAGGDPDLFLEVIRFDETRTYLQHIIEFLNIYKLIYTRIP